MVNFTFENEQTELSEEVMLSLADEMASAATTFNSHGYESFIQSREKFKTALHQVFQPN